jgi:hypothetical protein
MSDKKRIFRNEWKYIIAHDEADLIKDRLLPFLKLDRHAGRNGYEIRSLYFDDIFNSAYVQKLMGVYARKKWRIRIYNYSDSKISLERKLKNGNYIYKESADLTREECERIIAGDYGFMLKREENLCREFYAECTCNMLRPKVIVDYVRFPMVMDEGTVRITFDSEVCAAVGGFDIFDSSLPKLPAQEPDREILEVKYTEFIPHLIKQLLPPDGHEFVAFSKYVACYEAAHHLTDITAGISKTGSFKR